MKTLSELAAEYDTLEQQAVNECKRALKKYPHPWGASTSEYQKAIAPAARAINESLLQTFAFQEKGGPPHFSRENVWVWGGPTPNWGGSMEPDTALKGAEYFGAENVVYVYGPTDEDSIRLHRGCKKLLCQLSSINRSPGAQMESDTENAENLSRLSLKYNNIKGGLIDDLILSMGVRICRNELNKIYDNLKKHNPELRMYSVVYALDLDTGLDRIKLAAPFIDCVNLWINHIFLLRDLDMIIDKCNKIFPGKEIMLGLFIYDYGLLDCCTTPDILLFQLNRARKYLAEGKIHDLVIFGDREIGKCPAGSLAVKKYLAAEFNYWKKESRNSKK